MKLARLLVAWLATEGQGWYAEHRHIDFLMETHELDGIDAVSLSHRGSIEAKESKAVLN
jgi:hypothetical protein